MAGGGLELVVFVGLPASGKSTCYRRCFAAAARARGAAAVAIWFPASVRECLARNQHRQARARVPEVAILATAKRLRPPSTGEGFDRVRVARMTADGSFQVHDSAAGAQTWPAGGRVRQPGLW